MISSCDGHNQISHAPLASRPCRAFLHGTVAGRSVGFFLSATMKDLTGKVFGKLTAVQRIGKRRYESLWLCKCECGNTSQVGIGALNSGNTKSCGCSHKESQLRNCRKHGHSSQTKISPTYISWSEMKSRCNNPKHTGYERYGGRGITIFQSWMQFQNFLNDMGERPSGMTLERKDVNGNYDPDNCKWATKLEQANNTTTNKFITIKGRTKTIAEFSRESGIKAATLYYRVKQGWHEDKLLTARDFLRRNKSPVTEPQMKLL